MLQTRYRARSVHSNRETVPLFQIVAMRMPLLDMQSSLRRSRLSTTEDLRNSFYVGSGNNSKLVRKIMERRSNWKYSEDISRCRFRWQQSDNGFRQNGQGTQIINHIPNHRQLSLKGNLLANLERYCQRTKAYLWEITPVSFRINIKDTLQTEITMNKFKRFYTRHHPGHKIVKSTSNQRFYCKMTENPFTKPRMHRSMLSDDEYVWILKPDGFNRGRGIELFSTLEELNKLLEAYSMGVNDYKIPNTTTQIIKADEFVIQKYIQRPFLIDGRKFDIRVWVLVSQELDVYVFEQGYLRMASEQYTLQNLDTFIHLTNNAVQKHSNNYGDHEAGNQLSYQQFDIITNNQFSRMALPRIKSIIAQSMLSIQKSCDKKVCAFEIFGYDFMIDYQLKPWLIEINTNPCLDESSPLLSELLARMLDDAFKIVVDPTVRIIGQREVQINAEQSQDKHNKWEHLLQL